MGTSISVAGGVLGGGDSGGPLLWYPQNSADPSYPSSSPLRALDEREYFLGVAHTAITYTSIAQPENWSFVQSLIADHQGTDNCPGVYNPDQADSDGDGRGDACDNCPDLTVAQGDVPLGMRQPNCNEAVERERGLRPRGDACDPFPCNPTDEAYAPTDRRRDCLGGSIPPWYTDCLTGSYDVELGFAPRVASSGAAMSFDQEVAPSATPGNLVSPTWRCVCVRLDGTPYPDGEACSNRTDANRDCRRSYNPNTISGGRGWVAAPLQTPGVTTGAIHRTSNQAPFLPYQPRTTREGAAAAFLQYAGRATWRWNWDSLVENIPPIPQFVGGVWPQPTPARAIFWTRAQASSDPGAPTSGTDPTSATQLSQRLQDSYFLDGVPLINPHRRMVFNPFVFRRFNELLMLPMRPPIPDPCPWPIEHLVGRFLAVAYPLEANSPSWTAGMGFTNAPAGSPVRGLVLAQFDLRQAAVTASVLTQGAASDLPLNRGATYAVGAPDAYGWGDVAAFGGRNSINKLSAELFYTTHSYASDGTPQYVWHRASTTGTNPVAREQAALTYNSAGNRLYVVGGRGDNGTFSNLFYYDLTQAKWEPLTPSVALPARYDAAVAVRNDTLYVGGGATSPTAFLGDLWRVDGVTGTTVGYGSVLPLGGLPSLSFDDHGDGLVYGGGYYGSTWYADVWTVRFQGSQVITSFVRNFSGDGMVATPNYAVVADLHHRMFWGVPGYNPAGTAQDVRFLRDGTATVIKVNDSGGNSMVAARGSGSTLTNGGAADRAPPRQFTNRAGTPRATTIRPSDSRRNDSTEQPL